MAESIGVDLVPDPAADLEARRAALALFAAHVHASSDDERNRMVTQMIEADLRETFTGLELDDAAAQQLAGCLSKVARRLIADSMLLVVAALAAQHLEEERVSTGDGYMQALVERMAYLNDLPSSAG